MPKIRFRISAAYLIEVISRFISVLTASIACSAIPYPWPIFVTGVICNTISTNIIFCTITAYIIGAEIKINTWTNVNERINLTITVAIKTLWIIGSGGL